MMLHHAVSYDLTLRYLDFNVRVNDEGVYHHFLIVNNMSTFHCYQVHKEGEARNYHEAKTVYFRSKCLYNPFTYKLGLEAQNEISDNASDTKYGRTKNINIKWGSNDDNGQVEDPDVETVDLPGDD